MAVTLTDTGQVTFASFPIDKMESTADGDLMVYGKASDGSVDADQQVVDPKWMAKAVQDWLASGPNLRVQHNAQRDPAGVGVSASTDDAGATWVKGLVIEPIAQKLVSRGALRAYSVGIAHPTIERDVTGKARGGIITGGTLVEISLVDRPANKSCGIQLVKSADDGTAEYTGEMFGDAEVIAKYAEPEVSKADMSFTMPADMSVTFTPDDLMKIVQHKIVEKHYDELAAKAVFDAEAAVYKRDIDTATRRSLAGQGHALPDGSYPIASTEDLHNAAVLARSGHGNAEGAKRLIARRARELGVSNPLNDSSEKEVRVADEVTADVVTKDDVTQVAEPVTAKAKKPKKAKKMPPWMQDDAKGDDDSSCKQDHAHTEKCGTDPKTASGASEAADMDPMPHPDSLQESPMPAGRKTPDTKAVGSDPEAAALLRFKALGMDADLGRLHDLTCPAYDPEDVRKYHPFADFSEVIDLDVWMRKAVDAACGPMEAAIELTRAWEAAQILKDAPAAELNQYRLELHKAFRDANPGPSTYPSPGMMSPGRFSRPVITAGHAALSPGYGTPNSSPDVASSSPNATHFDRPPLSSGHQSPSPSHMKGGWEYPSEQGVPVNLTYAYIEKEKARQALATMHDHLTHQFPMACPMGAKDPHVQPEARPVPAAAGVSKGEEAEDEFIAKARKKMRKKLGKKVLSGKMTVDEARSRIGRNVTQKADEVVPDVAKSAEPEAAKGAVAELTAANFFSPELIKSAIADAIAPLVAKVEEQQKVISAQEARWEAAANLPDPATAAFSGIAMNPVHKNVRPVAAQAEIAERTQQIKRHLNYTVATSTDPFEREFARNELAKYPS